MKTLGVTDQFEGIFDIQSVNYVSKPARHPYITVVQALETEPERCIYIDDQARNLKEPKLLGMRTILIDAEPNEWVDEVIYDILDVGNVIAAMQQAEDTSQ
jgi:putative hydrolase of the HAD superfamily